MIPLRTLWAADPRSARLREARQVLLDEADVENVRLPWPSDRSGDLLADVVFLWCRDRNAWPIDSTCRWATARAATMAGRRLYGRYANVTTHEAIRLAVEAATAPGPVVDETETAGGARA